MKLKKFLEFVYSQIYENKYSTFTQFSVGREQRTITELRLLI